MSVGFLKKVFFPANTHSSREARPGTGRKPPEAATTSEAETAAIRRRSYGLSHFFAAFPESPHLQVLDLAGACQFNINYLSNFGCRIHAVDLLASLDEFRKDLPEHKFEAHTAQQFIDQCLHYGPGQMDAVLAWDCLEHLDSEVLDRAVGRIAHALRPGGALLTFFHTQSRGQKVDVNRYEIEDNQTLRLRVRQSRILPATYNNRGLEQLFSIFGSVKFFLTRDHLREVIAVR